MCVLVRRNQKNATIMQSPIPDSKETTWAPGICSGVHGHGEEGPLEAQQLRFAYAYETLQSMSNKPHGTRPLQLSLYTLVVLMTVVPVVIWVSHRWGPGIAGGVVLFAAALLAYFLRRIEDPDFADKIREIFGLR